MQLDLYLEISIAKCSHHFWTLEKYDDGGSPTFVHNLLLYSSFIWRILRGEAATAIVLRLYSRVHLKLPSMVL